MAKNYLHEGWTIAVPAPTGGVHSGDPILVGGFFAKWTNTPHLIRSLLSANQTSRTGTLVSIGELLRASEPQQRPQPSHVGTAIANGSPSPGIA